MAPAKIKENRETVQEYSKTMIHFVLDAFKNLNTIPEGESRQLKCAGLDVSRPRTRFDGNRIVFSMKLQNSEGVPSDLKDNFCDREDQELLQIDPRTFTTEQQNVINKWIIYEHYNQQFSYLFETGKRGYAHSASSFMDILSPVAQTLSSHSFLQDHCREHHKRFNAQKCAFVYAYAKPWEDYNKQVDASKKNALDERNVHDPADIDVNSDDMLEVDGEFYSDLWHYEQVEAAIRAEQRAHAMQALIAQRVGEYLATMEDAEERYATRMAQFYDTDEYCEDHEEVECDDRKKAVKFIKDKLQQEKEAKEREAEHNIDLNSTDFRPCESKGVKDCEFRYDRKLKKYIKREAAVYTP
jgi:hypothetical protein